MIVMGAKNCSDTYNCIFQKTNIDSSYLPVCINLMVIIPFVIDIFFMKLTPLDSVYIKLSIHDILFLISRVIPFSEQVTWFT